MFNKKGVTLAELMVAMVMIAITVVASMEFFRFCHKSFIVNSTLKLRAADLGRETMEGLYNDPGGTMGNHTVSMPPGVYGIDGWNSSYNISQGTEPTQGSDYRVITVTAQD